MEKVRVVKEIPGILKVGDILISPAAGLDFCMEETEITRHGTNERYASLDYVTVCENIPQYFEFEYDLDDEDEDEYLGEPEPNINPVVRTNDQIHSRYEIYRNKFNQSEPGSEAQVVYKNLMWFIEWLYGKAEIL